MASSSKPKRTYDVFLSFRGTDVRNNFLGHLYKALERNGIYTFRDSEELRKGDQISEALMKAIEESCIAIIVFSEDYASSWWCLEELAKIMECKKQNHLIVRPVFYKVEPREVRTGRKRYARALDDHEPKHGKEKVKTWKEALFDAGSLSGWTLNDEDESELIQKIVEEISTRLYQTPLQVAKHPVGIDSQVVKLKSILNLKSDDGALMLGLWGLGGIGKTSLAKALFNAMFRQFDGACFLEDVGGKSKDSRGLVELQKELLDDILLPQQRVKVSTVSRGINLIQHRLGDKRVLLILDNVDDLCQLNALAGDRKWFGNGSKIIVTTRDKHLLTCHQIDQDHVYEVEALNHTEAHELLSKHAFQTHQIRKGLVESALNYAKGLPLALVVLGSLLCGTTEDVWESTLKKLCRNPNKDINNVLKVSYDGLDEDQQEIFLHIACFFKGQGREYTKKVLECCELQPVEGFATLIKRSLISIEYGILKVHDLIQAMGIDIVNQECKDDPGKRSKLWLYNDVRNVLQDNKGDCAVKAIVLKPPEPIELCISPDAFTKMRKLRLLILHNVHISFQGPICLPNELRWLEWARCGHLILEFSSGPKELVALDISSCSITVAPNQFKGFQNLKYMNFSYCESMVRMPDLSFTPNLEELYMDNCKSLVEAHESIAYHDKLQVLHLRGCLELSVFPNELKSKNLQLLHLEKCPKFERFPDIPHKLKGLKEIYLKMTAIKVLPTSIQNLVSLDKMRIQNCKNLEHVPSSIYKLQNLRWLEVRSCTNLIGFPKYEDSTDPCMKIGLPKLYSLDLSGCNLSEVEFLENLSCFPILESLYLQRNNFTGLPTSITKRDRLCQLNVRKCHQLQEIPELPPLLNSFQADGCKSLQKFGDLTSFRHLVRKKLTMANTSPLDQKFRGYPGYLITLPEGEMPEWVLPIEEDSLSFMASEDLYNKFLGFALYIAFSKGDPGLCPFTLQPRVNGDPRSYLVPYYDCSDSKSMIWLEYFEPFELWQEVDFGQIDGSYAQFSIRLRGGKKWGFRIICKSLEDDLKVIIQDNQLMNPALLYEIVPESTNLEAEISLMHKDSSSEADLQKYLEDCLSSAKEHSQIELKRNQDFKRVRYERGLDSVFTARGLPADLFDDNVKFSYVIKSPPQDSRGRHVPPEPLETDDEASGERFCPEVLGFMQLSMDQATPGTSEVY